MITVKTELVRDKYKPKVFNRVISKHYGVVYKRRIVYLTLLQSLLVSDFKVVITCSGYTMNMLFQVIPCSDRLYQVMGTRLYHVLTGYALLYLVIPVITWYTKLLWGKLFKKSCGIVFTSCVSSYINIIK